MTNNYTEDQVIAFLYNELSSVEMNEMRAAIKADWSLQEQVNELKQTQSYLNLVEESPSDYTIARVLAELYPRTEGEVV